MMTLEPLYDKIIILPDEQSTTTESGLLIPLSAQKQKSTGTVVAVGKGIPQVIGAVLAPLTVKIGERVLFNEFTGTEVILNEKKHLIMREIEILAIMREDIEDKHKSRLNQSEEIGT